MTEHITLYMIPGSGTDRRMYMPQLERFENLSIPEWLPPLDKKESIYSYAKRLSATIDTSKPFILGGVSLGGMIAQEMALSLQPLAVLLIATANSSKALPWSRRMAGKITRALPDAAVKTQFKAMSWILRKFAPKTLAHKETYAQMLESLPPRLIRWQSGASTDWELRQPLTMRVFHIHGRKDRIIPVKNVKPDAVIEHGGHLINVTQAEQVNNLIETLLKETKGYLSSVRQSTQPI